MNNFTIHLPIDVWLFHKKCPIYIGSLVLYLQDRALITGKIWFVRLVKNKKSLTNLFMRCGFTNVNTSKYKLLANNGCFVQLNSQVAKNCLFLFVKYTRFLLTKKDEEKASNK